MIVPASFIIINCLMLEFKFEIKPFINDLYITFILFSIGFLCKNFLNEIFIANDNKLVILFIMNIKQK